MTLAVHAARDAVVDAAIAEHRAQQTASRLILSGLTRPTRSSAHVLASGAERAARSARQALREAVEQLLAAMGDER